MFKNVKNIIGLIVAVLCIVFFGNVISAQEFESRYVTLILDTSLSMEGSSFESEKKAAIKFCEEFLISSDNKVSIISMNEDAQIVIDFTEDINVIKESINSIELNHGTDFSEALDLADDIFEKQKNEDSSYSIVICSDGVPVSGESDMNGKYSFTEHFGSFLYANVAYRKAEKLKSKNYNIYSLAFMENSQGIDYPFGIQVMRDLATGLNNFTEVKNVDELEFSFIKIADEILPSNRKIDFTYSVHDKEYNYNCYFSDDYFSKNAKEYNPSLATMSLSLAMSAFASTDGGYENYENKSKNVVDLLKKIGCDSNSIYVNEGFKVKPSRDTIGVAVGNKEILSNGDRFTLLVVSIRGGGYEQEWSNNVKIGSSGLHEGFDNASNKVISEVENYILENNVRGKVKVWVVGFSRAAAVANLFAQKICTNKISHNMVEYAMEDVYGYTFETPIGGQNISESSFDNIFNIINKNDPVTKVAPANWNMSRFGKDKYIVSRETSKNYSYYKDKMLDRFIGINEDSKKYSIDDFPLNSTLASILDSLSINFRISQSYFLDDYVDLISREGLVSRENYFIEYQKSLEDAFAIFGVKSEVISRFNYNLALYGGITKVLFSGSDKTVKQIISEVMSQSLLQSGINPDSVDFDRLINTILPLIKKLTIIDIKKMMIALMNSYNLVQAHYPELCLAWLVSADPNYNDGVSTDIFSNGGYRVVRINCPVDVYIYDENGIVGSIENEIPNGNVNGLVYGLDSENQKYCILPYNEKYKVKIVARESCKVNIGMMDYSDKLSRYTTVLNYFDVDVAKGESLECDISSREENETKSLFYVYKDEEEISPTSEFEDDEISINYIKVVSEDLAKGMVIGGGYRRYGTFVKLDAYPEEGFLFDGWFKQGKLLSKDKSYRLRVDRDETIVAKFKKEGDDNKNDDGIDGSSSKEVPVSKDSQITETENEKIGYDKIQRIEDVKKGVELDKSISNDDSKNSGSSYPSISLREKEDVGNSIKTDDKKINMDQSTTPIEIADDRIRSENFNYIDSRSINMAKDNVNQDENIEKEIVTTQKDSNQRKKIPQLNYSQNMAWGIIALILSVGSFIAIIVKKWR